MTVKDALDRAREAGTADPARADRLYRSIIEAHPGYAPARFAYGMFLNQVGRWEESTVQLGAIAPSAPEYPDAILYAAFGFVALDRFEEAIASFFGYFTVADPEKVIESHIIYTLNFVGLESGFDYGRTAARLEAEIAARPALAASRTADRLRAALESRIRQVYAADRHISGFVLFADLVDSSRYKREHPDTWRRRIIHFLLYSRYSFAYLGFQFLKFIGDEVMMFWPLEEAEKPQAARLLFDFIVRNRWYLDEVNRFNPARFAEGGGGEEHEIKVKVFCGEVRDALVFHPSDEGPFDIVGEDVDRAARIKESAQPNFLVVDGGFRDALRANGGAYAEAFRSLAWEGAFKGIGGVTAYYGERIPAPRVGHRPAGLEDFGGPVFRRRSVRDFEDRPFPDEMLDRILAAAMSAPSAGDQQPWEFVVVRDRSLLGQLAAASPYAGPLARAPVGVALCGVASRSASFPEFWTQDCAAAMENLLIQAVVEGAAGVWLGFHPEADRVATVGELLGLPEGVTPLAIAALGYAKNPVKPRARFDAGRVHRERW